MAEPSVAKRPEVTQGAGPARRTPDAHAATSGAPAAQRQYMAQLAQEQKGTQGAAPPAAGGARTPGQKQAALKKVNLGAVKDLDTGFSSKVGQIIDVVCPKVGDLTVLQVEANIPISAGVSVIFRGPICLHKQVQGRGVYSMTKLHFVCREYYPASSGTP